MKEFLTVLKFYRQSVKLEDWLEKKLNQMTVNFSFVHLFYLRFIRLCSKCTFELMTPQAAWQRSDYSKNVKSLGWLLFIAIRNQLITRGRTINLSNQLPSTMRLLANCLAYVLTFSSTMYSIHFSLTATDNEQAVIPGNCKQDMGQQITEYVCKQLAITFDEDCGKTTDQFNQELQIIKNGCQAEGHVFEEWIGDPNKIDILCSQVSEFYKKQSKEDEIDDIIFFADSNVGACLIRF